MKNLILFPVLHKNITDLPFYITGIGMDYIERGVVRNDGFQDYQWAYCVQGSGKFTIECESFEIRANTAFFFRKDIPHHYYPLEEPWVTKWITFNGGAVDSLLNYMNIKKCEIVILNQEKDLDYIMEDLYNTLSSSDNEKHLTASSLLYKFLIKIKNLKETSCKEDAFNLLKKLQPVISLMDENYSRVITLEEMAKEIDVSKHYLCRVFKKAYFVTPFEYLTQLRIQKSKELIINNKHLKIKEIAYSVGFNDVSYFCSKFKKIEGCTPFEFKRLY